MMEKILEFKILHNINNIITADLYINGIYIVRLSDNLKHILDTSNTDVVLYDYFRQAVLHHLDHIQLDGSMSNSVAIH